MTRLRSESIVHKASAHLGMGSGMKGLFIVASSLATRGRLEGPGPSSNIGRDNRAGGMMGVERCWDCCCEATNCKSVHASFQYLYPYAINKLTLRGCVGWSSNI